MKFNSLHIIYSLKKGGAERALLRLHESRRDVVIYCVTESLEYCQYKTERIEFGKGLMSRLTYVKFYRLYKEIKPHKIFAWLYTAEIFILLFNWLFYEQQVTYLRMIRNSYKLRPSLMNKIYYYFLFLFNRYCEYDIYVSEESRESFLKLLGDRRSTVLRNYFSPTGLNTLPRARDIDFLWVGRQSNAKNINLFLRIASHYPSYNFVVCGKGFNSTLMPNNCRYMGIVSDMDSVYIDSYCLIQTSLSEGIPNVIGEAMSFGCYVIASDVGGTREICGSLSSLVEEIRLENYIYAIDRFLKNKELIMADMAERVLWIEENFSFSNYMETYETLFNEDYTRL